VISSIIGKVELVYEGELEGPSIVAVNLIGEATKKAFAQYFPAPRKPRNTLPKANASKKMSTSRSSISLLPASD
jgi:magnesium chelatase subunit I